MSERKPRRFVICRMYPTATYHNPERLVAHPAEEGTLSFNMDAPENTEFIEVEEVIKPTSNVR